MKVGLAPDLTGDEKRSLKRWLVSALAHARLSSSGWPLGSKIGVYIDGTAVQTYNGYWTVDGQRLHIGTDTTDGRLTNLVDRIAVLGAIISAVELWPELTDQYSAAVSRVLLESYNTAMSGLVQTRAGIATGLAFSADRNQVAARIGDEWFLPSGEAVTAEELARTTEAGAAVWTLVE